MNTALMIILLVLGVFLTIAVLLQHGKSHGLGTITGSAETFLGKEKGTKLDRILARLTTVVGILFVVVVLAVYIMQPTYSLSNKHQSLWQSSGLSEHYGMQEQQWVGMPDESTTEDDTTEGDTTEDDTTEGDTTEGDTTEGDTTEGDTTESDTTEGDTTEGDTAEAATTAAN